MFYTHLSILWYWYYEFLNKQVKELHMERSQRFITSVFSALTGSRCKTWRKQVTGIPPTLVTIGSHTPATPIDAATSKTLSEDVTQAELVAMLPEPPSLNEEPVEKPSGNNQLGESYIADVQHNGKHIPFHCTDVDEHKHLTNHFNECLSDKIYKMFKDLFSNVNLDSILKSHPKISVYNKIITQFVEETNFKYGLDLKFTKLESPEVGLWAKTFQVAGHNKDQQLPSNLHCHNSWNQPNYNHSIHNNNHTKQHYVQINCHLLNSGWKLTNWPVWLQSGIIIPVAHLCCH